MPQDSFDTDDLTTRAARTRYSVLFLAVCAVVAFYAWSVAPGESLFGKFDGAGSYYNLLSKGFKSGHLSLPVEVPAGVLKLKNPYDPRQNAPFGMHDVSYYKGRFYLYFGPAPALVLYGPFSALTGLDLNDRQAVFLFCSAAFIASCLLLSKIRRDHFPEAGIAQELGGIVAIGLVTMVPDLLRRQEVYEVAVSSAHAFFTFSILCLYLSLQSRPRLAWLALASVCYGLAIASRPTYLFGAVCLLAPAFLVADSSADPEPRKDRRVIAPLCAGLIPVAVLIGGVLVYNDLRFDSPFEFGYHFAFSGANESTSTHFSASFCWFNCRVYLFEPAHLSAYFPFVRVISPPTAPPGYMGVEDPYGILPNIPFVVLALAAPLAFRQRHALKIFASAVFFSSLATAAVIFTFQFAANRYMVDFLPGFVILSVVGFWALGERLAGPARRLALGAAGAALVWSVLFNVFASFGHNEFLRTNNPLVYRRLVHAFGCPRYELDRILGRNFGPVEITLKFPTDKKGKLEPLVITGSNFLSDYLYVYYDPSGKVAIGFEHTSYGGPVTEPIPIDLNQPHRIRVDMPPLYPPLGDPYFDGVPDATVAAFGERLKVSLDGASVIDTTQQFYPPFSIRPGLGGGSASQVALGRRFTGEILGTRILPADWNSSPQASGVGPLVMTLEFPVFTPDAPEPLVALGYNGRGDILYVNYLDLRHVTLSFDHWGVGGPTSQAIEIKPGVRQTLEVRFGSFFPETRRPAGIPASRWAESGKKLEVLLDGIRVFDANTPFYDVPADTLVVGRNSIGSSGCAARFSGKILDFTQSCQRSP